MQLNHLSVTLHCNVITDKPFSGMPSKNYNKTYFNSSEAICL